jgi:hypothetical protein
MQRILKKPLNTIPLLLGAWLCLAVCQMPAAAADTEGDEAVLKAVFVYNFARFTRWPADVWNQSSEQFHICTQGHNHVSAALDQLRGLKLKGREVVVSHLDDRSDTGQCQLLYIARPDVKIFYEAHCCLPVLTISDADGFATGMGMIELYVRDQRVRFRINLKAVRQSGMDINAQLLQLADQVIQGSRP